MLQRIMPIFARTMVALSVPVLLAGQQQAFAGAWTMPEGKGQVIVSGLYAEAQEAFDDDGSSEGVPVFRKAELSTYAEYGINDWLTAIGQIEGQAIAVDRPLELGRSEFAVGMAGGRIRLWRNDGAVLSVEAAGRLAPAEDDVPSDGLPGGGVDLRVLGGYGFALGEWPSFIDVEGAFRARFNAAPGEFRIDATAGTRPRERLLFLAQSFNVLPADGSSGGSDGHAEHKLELSAVYDLTETLSVQAGGIATVAGRNALREQDLVTAIWFRF